MIASIQMADVRAQVRVKVKRLDRRDVVQYILKVDGLGLQKMRKEILRVDFGIEDGGIF